MSETRFRVPPTAALAAVRAFDGPLIVDFDETLYLRNSTEDFIDCAAPGLLALLILRFLDLVRPWAITSDKTRDNWRVLAITIFMPWTHWLWRRTVRARAAEHFNKELCETLNSASSRPIIVTSGFKMVIAPLLAHSGVTIDRLLAARLLGFQDRRHGKLAFASAKLNPAIIRESLVLTDSRDDLDLLQVCRRPLLTIWPEARLQPALGRVYLPGQYVSRVKHPGERYIFSAILQQDFVFWVLSSVWLASDVPRHILGLALLCLSFWVVYERGYVENDIAAAKYEEDPKLSSEFGVVTVATPFLMATAWALASGFAGVALLHRPGHALALDYAAWVGVLGGTYGLYFVYNRVDKFSRVWVYPFLQLARAAAFAVVVAVEPAGVALLGAFVCSRWLPYIAYRLQSTKWPDMHVELVRLIMFVILLALLCAIVDISRLATYGSAALLLWSLYRARRSIAYVVQHAELIKSRARAMEPADLPARPFLQR